MPRVLHFYSRVLCSDPPPDTLLLQGPLMVHVLALPWDTLMVHVLAPPWDALMVHVLAPPWNALMVHVLAPLWDAQMASVLPVIPLTADAATAPAGGPSPFVLVKPQSKPGAELCGAADFIGALAVMQADFIGALAVMQADFIGALAVMQADFIGALAVMQADFIGALAVMQADFIGALAVMQADFIGALAVMQADFIGALAVMQADFIGALAGGCAPVEALWGMVGSVVDALTSPDISTGLHSEVLCNLMLLSQRTRGASQSAALAQASGTANHQAVYQQMWNELELVGRAYQDTSPNHFSLAQELVTKAAVQRNPGGSDPAGDSSEERKAAQAAATAAATAAMELLPAHKRKRMTVAPGALAAAKFPEVQRDGSGMPVMPISLGPSLRVLRLGNVDPRPTFHSENYIWPVKYRSERHYASCKDPDARVVYTCEIVDGGGVPEFRVTAADAPEEPISSLATLVALTRTKQAPIATVRTPGVEGPFAAADTRIRNGAATVSGPEMFGFAHPTIHRLILELPGVESCTKYVGARVLHAKPEIKQSETKSAGKGELAAAAESLQGAHAAGTGELGPAGQDDALMSAEEVDDALGVGGEMEDDYLFCMMRAPRHGFGVEKTAAAPCTNPGNGATDVEELVSEHTAVTDAEICLSFPPKFRQVKGDSLFSEYWVAKLKKQKRETDFNIE
eukprot:gene4620-5659_t